MYLDAIYSFVIGLVGAILFVLVDKNEPDGPLARLLKFLVLFVSMVAILHSLRPYGLACFSQRECGAFPPSLGARPALRLPRARNGQSGSQNR
jgi:hypothetical protein